MKKLTTFLLALMLSFSIKADYLNDINAWTGQGENYSVLVIDFADATKPSSFMWGVRYDSDSISGQELLDAVIAADPNFSGTMASFITDVYYKTFEGKTPSDFSWYWLTYSLSAEGGNWGSNNGNSTKLGNGQAFGAVYSNAWPGNNPATAISADELPSEKAVTTTSDIIQWIGKGENASLFVVDFQDGTTPSSFAWGVRYDSDSLTGQQIVDAVLAADTNLKGSFDGFITDVFYKEHEGVTPVDYAKFWAAYTSNGDYNWTSNNGNSTKLGNNQWFGISFTEYPNSISPSSAVTAVINSNGIGDVVVVEPTVKPSVEGIAMDDSKIKLWADGITVNRGYINIQNPLAEDDGSVRASYGIPENALGQATGTATDVVSLGDSGTAVLTFSNNMNYVITNGEGADFVVFENAFNATNLELAFVEVSSDGVNFVRFPAKSLTSTATQVGSFGALDPSKIFGMAGIHPAGVGTPFDLEILAGISGLDINQITHVKIVDAVGVISGVGTSFDTLNNPINDPFPTAFKSGGFDLEAVGVLNYDVASGVSAELSKLVSVYPNPTTSSITITGVSPIGLSLIDYSGRELVLDNTSLVNLDNFDEGSYILKITTLEGVVIEKIQIRR